MPPITRSIVILTLAALPALLIGCARQLVEVPNPLPIAEAEYDRVFDAAVDVLRAKRFVVDRQDRRFGVITTKPMVAASVFEPWRHDNHTDRQALEATLHHQRRIVRVSLKPRRPDVADAAADPPADPTPTSRANFLLQVDVAVERRHHPDRHLTTAAFATIGFHNRAGHVTRTEAGYESSAWVPLANDPILEQQLVADIIRRSIHIDERVAANLAIPDPQPSPSPEPEALSDAADPN